MNKDLVEYVETKILPKYADGSGHSLEHIKYVIDRSMKFAKQVPGTNKNMCYVIAAYHDLGRLLDDDYHELISANFARIDKELRKYFSEEEIETIAEAIEDHRASSKREPRSVYGRIVSSADRSTSADEVVKRAVEAHSYWNQDGVTDEAIEEAREHVMRKHGKGGYALSKMYFDDPEFKKCCEQIADVAKDFDTFKARYLELKER